MDDHEIAAIAESLEHASDAAEVRMRASQGMAPQWIRIEANRTGLLRLAATVLRAAAKPVLPNDCVSDSVSVWTEYPEVFHKEGTFVIEDVRRLEAWPEPEQTLLVRRRTMWRRDRLALIGCAVIAFAFLFLVVSGVAFWWTLVKGR